MKSLQSTPLTVAIFLSYFPIKDAIGHIHLEGRNMHRRSLETHSLKSRVALMKPFEILKRTTSTVKFSEKEIQFLEQNELCRFATASKKGEPHVVPVSYVWHDGFPYIVTDYGTKKLKNLRENPHAAVLVDTAGTQKLLLVSGPVAIIEKGEEYKKLYKIFHSKLEWVKRDPWKEGEAPFVKINPTFKAGWGLRNGK